MQLRQLYLDMGSDLSAIEQQLEDAVAAEHPELQKASLHLLKAGGKRIRPVFAMVCGQFGDGKAEDVKKVAVALELIHMASLVHDDVVDNAKLRRGRETIKSKWDNRIAMYTGDFMFSRALGIISQVDHQELHRILADAMVEMTIGEMAQIHDLGNWQQSLRNYLRRIKRKTALLIAVSCCLGACAAGVDKKVTDVLYRFGYNIGMSFQITDDVLDFTGSESQLGKPAGGDLKQRNVTLPTLYALYHSRASSDVADYLHSPDQNDHRWKDIFDVISDSGGIGFARQISARYLSKAYELLRALPDMEVKQSLVAIADYMGQRRS